MYVIQVFGINTTCDISKLSQISRAVRITILKCHSWYLCQISLQIMLLPIQILHNSTVSSFYNIILYCALFVVHCKQKRQTSRKRQPKMPRFSDRLREAVTWRIKLLVSLSRREFQFAALENNALVLIGVIFFPLIEIRNLSRFCSHRRMTVISIVGKRGRLLQLK